MPDPASEVPGPRRAGRWLLAVGIAVAAGGVAMIAASLLGAFRGDAAPGERPARTAPARVLVASGAGPERDVVVRLAAHDAEEGCDRALCAPARTDAAGLATLEVPDPVPAGAHLEVGKSDAGGLRHGSVAWDSIVPATDGIRRVRLPSGGALRVALVGLPIERLPPRIKVQIFAPPPFCEPLFDDSDVAGRVPAAEGGLAQEDLVADAFLPAVGQDGVATLDHVPGDHALMVVVDAPPGWMVQSVAFSGRVHEARDGEVLRVPEGATATYTMTWRRRPRAILTVTDEGGRPITGATVSVGLSGPSPSLFEPPERTGRDGRVVIDLWTGPRLPSWLPDGLVGAATAEGFRARVLSWPFRWADGTVVEQTVVLAKDGGALRTIEGRLHHEDGRPAGGVPLVVRAHGDWNGHALLPPLQVRTNAVGLWRLVLREDAGPLFERAGKEHGGEERAGKFEVRVDADEVPPRPRGSRGQRAEKIEDGTLVPSVFDVPAEGATTRADAVLRIPR